MRYLRILQDAQAKRRRTDSPVNNALTEPPVSDSNVPANMPSGTNMYSSCRVLHIVIGFVCVAFRRVRFEARSHYFAEASMLDLVESQPRSEPDGGPESHSSPGNDEIDFSGTAAPSTPQHQVILI